AGSSFGELLPTGRVVDTVNTEAGAYPVSIVDVTNPFALVPASFFGLEGTESPHVLNGNEQLLQAIESLRGHCAVLLGLVSDPGDARSATPRIPKIALIANPKDHFLNHRRRVRSYDHDLIVRSIGGR